jgi:hypothetical protein
MRKEQQELLSYFGSQALVLYLAVNENLTGAAAIPLTLYGLTKGAKMLKLDQISRLAYFGLLGTFTAAPGALVGRCITTISPGQFVGKTISFIFGACTTCFTFSRIAAADKGA